MTATDLTTAPDDPYQVFAENKLGLTGKAPDISPKNTPTAMFNMAAYDISGARLERAMSVDPNGPDHARSITAAPDLLQQLNITRCAMQDGHYAGMQHRQSDIGQLGESCAAAASELMGALSNNAGINYAHDPALQQDFTPARPAPGLFG